MARRPDPDPETASQTAGPYVHIGCLPSVAGFHAVFDGDLGASPIIEGAKGDVITVEGKIFDGYGDPLLDGMIETWQADAKGLYAGQAGADPKVPGFGRRATDAETGAFSFRTIRPGAAKGQAPHIAFWIVARGINIGLLTRLYFPEDNHSDDPILSRIETAERAKTLIAAKIGDAAYRFDIRLQGDGETVFLDM
ncbi:MAG: protocatechuate 3,4-dioxygenase subunit alpha [Silicimonas sp.]|nr:protocatechuate 3,4-dioxygenase subunit alpha [Silicimonas sp.]